MSTAMMLRQARTRLHFPSYNNVRYFQDVKVFQHMLNFDAINSKEKLPSSLFENRVVMVVNTASNCGYTPQLAGLQTLFLTYKDRGLTVLAVPSNDFGGQEPDDEKTIEAFYQSKYGVQFPITTKSNVVGPNAHPFFRAIVEHYSEEAAPEWNFDKFIVDHTGDLSAVFPASVEPLEEEVIEAIEKALAELPQNVRPVAPETTTW